MKITNEIFDRYIAADDKDIIAMSEEFEYDNPADFEEDMYIWSVNHGDKEKVMAFYQMTETEYADSCEAWADEAERGTK